MLVSRSYLMLREEKGSIAVMTAIVLVGILGCLALGIDLGMVLLNKRQLANAVDAAALAGVQALPNRSLAVSLAYDYGELNNLSRANMTVHVSEENNEVAVTGNREVELFFAPVLGIRRVPVSVRAKARTGPVSGVRGAVPLSVREQEFVYGARYMLKAGAGPSEYEDIPGGQYGGNFGAIDLGGSGASTYEENLKNGFPGILRVGDVISTETGNMSGPTRRGINWRLSQPEAVSCNLENAGPSCPQYVIVPIVTDYISGGTGLVEVLGFAAFFLEGTTKEGGEDYVIGRFLQRSVDGEIGETNHDYGLRAYKLVE